MTETEVVNEKKSGADVEVDGNSVATFTKEHHNTLGLPYLTPPGAKTSEAEAEATAKGEWHR